MAKHTAKKRDEYLPNGSAIYWSRRFRDGTYASGRTRRRVPVRCGGCGQVREIRVSAAQKQDFTGLCHTCASLKATEDETLDNGSVIYWSRRFVDRRGHRRVPVRCGGCGEVREIGTNVAQEQDFTGLCRACTDLGKAFPIPRSTLERLYCKEGLTQREVAGRLGCSPSVVERAMRRYGIKARPSADVPRILVPEEVLRCWTPELAYVVGLVTADGNLKKRSNRVTFPSIDRELIEIYQQCLGVSLHVYTHHKPGRLPSYSVALSDPAYRGFLEGVGLTPAKTKDRTLGTLKIPDEFFRDFFRGVIDGDGTIGVYAISKRQPNTRRLTVRLPSVCQPFLVWIRDTIARLAVVEGTVYRVAGGFILWFGGRKAHHLLTWLYYAPDLPCLQRKRGVWEIYARERGSSI